MRLPATIIPPVVILPSADAPATIEAPAVTPEPITDEDDNAITDEEGSPIFED